MKILSFSSREEWLAGRYGRITGSKAKDIIVKRGTGKKIGTFQLIADQVAVQEEGGEAPMDRGTRLEPEACAKFAEATGKKLNTDLVIWTRNDNENIAYSPDAFVAGKRIKEAVECKCLASAKHLEAFITQEVPSEYVEQTRQAFVVNEDLETLYLVFYDPRIQSKSLFWIVINREDIQDEIDFMLEYENNELEFVKDWVEKLTF